MPWITDENGEIKYTLSIYTKEELPTWSEMYNDFWLKEIFSFNEKSDQTPDRYWKIPHNKYILAIACNQLNKMVYEDKFDISKVSELFDREVKDVIFNLTSYEYHFDHPDIYSFPMPDGSENPFILNNLIRMNINNLAELSLIIIIKFTDNYSAEIDINSELFIPILEIFMKPYIEYFKEPIGFKDIKEILSKELQKAMYKRNDKIKNLLLSIRSNLSKLNIPKGSIYLRKFNYKDCIELEISSSVENKFSDCLSFILYKEEDRFKIRYKTSYVDHLLFEIKTVDNEFIIIKNQYNKIIMDSPYIRNENIDIILTKYNNLIGRFLLLEWPDEIIETLFPINEKIMEINGNNEYNKNIKILAYASALVYFIQK